MNKKSSISLDFDVDIEVFRLVKNKIVLDSESNFTINFSKIFSMAKNYKLIKVFYYEKERILYFAGKNTEDILVKFKKHSFEDIKDELDQSHIQALGFSIDKYSLEQRTEMIEKALTSVLNSI